MNFANEARDILRDCMHKSSQPIAWGILLVTLMLLIVLTVAAGAAGLHDESRSFGVAPAQGLTPTPTAEPRSQPGSTVGIWWMGVAIVVIVLLPVVARRIFWS